MPQKRKKINFTKAQMQSDQYKNASFLAK